MGTHCSCLRLQQFDRDLTALLGTVRGDEGLYDALQTRSAGLKLREKVYGRPIDTKKKLSLVVCCNHQIMLSP